MTPLKLKRKTQHLESTLDRTLQHTLPKHSLKDIIPSFAPSREPLRKIDCEPFKAKTTTHVTQTSTFEFQQEIYRNICEDNQKSQYPQQYGSKNKAYTDYPDRMKIVRASPWSIPEEILQIYRQKQASSGQPTYGHGCLSKSAIYYFAVQNRVLFYDLGNAVRFNRKLDQCLLLDLAFEQTIFQLKEIDWCSPFFKQVKNKNIVIISSPWQLQFAVLEIEDSGHKQVSKTSSRWLKITMLNQYFATNCRRALFLTEGNQELFYLNQRGAISKLGIENNSFWQRIFDGRKQKLSTHTTKYCFSKNYFYTNKKTSFLDKFKHFRKVIASSFSNIFNNKTSINGLVYDKTRKLLFSLIDSHKISDSIQYSYSKLISCWKVINGKLSLVCQISEVQLIASSTNQQIFTHTISKNNKIVRICSIPECYYPNCNLLAILQNGTRLYLKIQDETFQISSYQFPPSLEVRGKNKKRECVQYTKPVELVHFHTQASTKILTIKQNDHNHTFIIFKENQLKEVQMVSHIPWNQTIYQGDCGNPPIQSFLFKSSLGYTNSKKSNLLKIFSSKPNKMIAAIPENVPYMHQILRDVFDQLSMFVHTTDTSLEHFHILRPVDIILMIIRAQIFEPKIIWNILDLPKKQIQFLLMQLLCDDEGTYLYDSTLTDCMNNYRNKCLQTGQYKSFQVHQQQFYKQIAYNKSKKIKVKQNEPQILQPNFSQSQYLQICDLILRLCQQPSNSHQIQIKHEQRCYSQIKQIIDCSLVYLSRILRYVWMLDLSQIPTKAVFLVQMIDPLLKIINTIFDKQYISRSKILIANSQKNQTVYKNRVNSIYWFDKNKQQTNKQNQFEQSLDVIEKIKYFVNKIIQLLLMTTQTTLKINKKFYACLGMEPQFFEQHIFNYLIINYQQPFKMLESYRKSFPIFIGKNLQKSLKIYNETTHLSTKSIYQTAKHHKDLPDYLLAYLKSQKGIKQSEVKQIAQNKEQTLKFTSPSGSKQMISQLKKRITQQYLNIIQRNKLIYIANKELQIYNQQKGKSEDTFYRTMKRQINETLHILNIQEIIISEYQNRKGAKDISLIENLKNEILKKQGLKDIISAMETPRITIVYYYYFQNQQSLQNKQQLQNIFKHFFQQQYELVLKKTAQQNSSFTKYLSLNSKSKNSKWKHLQNQLRFIINKTKQFLFLPSFVEILKNALQSTRISKQLHDKSTQLQTIPSLKKFMLFDFKSNNLNTWIDTSDYPIISLILIESGIPINPLQKQYMELLRQHSLSQRINHSQLPFILHIWLNLYCLLIQHTNGTQIFDFADHTKKFVTLIQKGAKADSVIYKKTLLEMKQLTEILVYTKHDHQKIGNQYFQWEIQQK